MRPPIGIHHGQGQIAEQAKDLKTKVMDRPAMAINGGLIAS